MHHFIVSILFTVVFGGATNSYAATRLHFPADVTCYDDNSLDAVQRDNAALWQNFGFAPVPEDCAGNPQVYSDRDGAVYLNGREIFRDRFDSPKLLKVSPVGPIGILTESGKLYRWSATSGLTLVLGDSIDRVASFVMARNGNMAAMSDRNALLTKDGWVRRVTNVHHIFANRAGDLIAFYNDGELVDATTGVSLYLLRVDEVEAIKLRKTGSVVWLSKDGAVGETTLNGRTREVYSGRVDGAESFQINDRGDVVYRTRGGKIGRNGKWLIERVRQVQAYRLGSDGAVSAVDERGDTHYFPPEQI